jgi:hypothetical protein
VSGKLDTLFYVEEVRGRKKKGRKEDAAAAVYHPW